MRSGLLLDTHILLWLGEEKPRIRKAVLVEISEAAGNLWLSAISAWEIAMLVAKGRLLLNCPPRQWLAQSLAHFDIQMIPVDQEVAFESYELGEDFHGDPADRMIVATAHLYGLRLLTTDKLIQRYARNGYVKTLC